MNNSALSTNNQPLDSLDQQRDLYYRVQSGHSQSNNPENQIRHDHMLKNLYKQQLDQIMRQKNEQKQAQRERQTRERREYNQRMHYGRQAQKMKEISYKNYYQMLLNNQTSISKNYVSPFSERDSMKERLISNGVEEDRKRSQIWYQQEQRRIQDMKKHYREDLKVQVQEKQFKNAVQNQVKTKNQDDFRKVTLSPHELNKYERQRKLMEMQKYKQDLDKSKRQTGHSPSNYRQTNDFNMQKLEDRHDLLVNPLPFNIQNPYILRQFRKNEQRSMSGSEKLQNYNSSRDSRETIN